jgi:N-formylglutamate deformylase
LLSDIEGFRVSGLVFSTLINNGFGMRLPFVISIPHCSKLIPAEIRPAIALEEEQILDCTDRGTREIFSQFPVRTILWARWSRLVVDLNRSHLQRDSTGVVPEVDYFQRRIYKEGFTPNDEEVRRRLRRYYWPYHDRLKEALQDKEIKVLFDCHSLSRIGPPGAPDRLQWRKDIVLGNNGDAKGGREDSRGTITCAPDTLLMMKNVLEELSFSVCINHPYAGGFITTHYGEELFSKGKMAVQIEINQSLYMDHTNPGLRMDMVSDVSRRLVQALREIARML